MPVSCHLSRKTEPLRSNLSSSEAIESWRFKNGNSTSGVVWQKEQIVVPERGVKLMQQPCGHQERSLNFRAI
jgi:hypothetical protein